MIDLSSYKLKPLRDDGNFILSRGTRLDGKGGSVLVLSTTQERPAPWLTARMLSTHALRQHLDGAPVTRPLELSEVDGKARLVLSDPGGILLEKLTGEPMALPKFLRIAIGIAAAVGQFHGRGLIHKDIKPANILIDEKSGEAWLIGVGLASLVPRHRQSPEAPEIIAGTLPYMAPEQTGRMNRSIDSRSDLYSLGVTFYEMLVGALPFTAGDPMEWVHCHIARRAISPSERVKGIPEAVSSIVMKLLAKTAEERYQTAAGMEADLRRCLMEWTEKGWVERFEIGEDDVSDRLMIPEGLYGREKEIELLLTVFDGVARKGTTSLVLVSGYSGVGKSSVVNELHKALVPPRGMFASGKFDQFKRDIPYATLAEAFQRLIQQILTRSDAEVTVWQEAFQGVLGVNGEIIVNLIPELELIIGKQPAAPELPPQETKNRFQNVMRKFIGVFAAADHPLALFLDDLQWLDAGTLQLLEYLLTEPEMRHLMIVGAYRDNEVGPEHPLMRTLGLARAGGAPVEEIVLAPLGLEDVNALVADSLRTSRENSRPLAEMLHEKTGGNPFFTIQFLSMLEEEGLVSFDQAKREWQWDLEGIRAKGYTDNVVALMGRKLNAFPRPTQEVMKILACLGNAAPIATLAVVCGEREEAVETIVADVVEAGLVVRTGRDCSFFHDRVQEAAYALIPEEKAPEMHLKIGRLLTERATRDEIEEKIFEVVNQFNRGVELISGEEERERVAGLNLTAGRRAMASTADASALGYLSAGLELLGGERWKDSYTLTYELTIRKATCEMIHGNLEASERLIGEILRCAKSDAEKAAAYRLKIELHVLKSENKLAVESALECLRLFGIEMSPHPERKELDAAFEEVWRKIDGRKLDALIDLPLTDDPEVEAAMSVLSVLYAPAFFTDPRLTCLHLCKMVILTLDRGATGASAHAFGWFGIMLGHFFGKYAEGYRFGELAHALVERHRFVGYESKSLFSLELLSLWTQPMTKAINFLDAAFAAAKESGDVPIACYCCNHRVSDMLTRGDGLENVWNETQRGLAFVTKANFRDVADILVGQERFVQAMRGLTVSHSTFDGDGFEERRFEEQLTPERMPTMVCWYWLIKAQARWMYGEYDDAKRYTEKAHALIWASTGHIQYLDYHFYSALILAALPAEGTSDEERLRGHCEQLAHWAACCPETFADKHRLVEAEIARMQGREAQAERLYEEAIGLARANQLPQDEAIASELAARFHEGRGLQTAADAYLRNARQCYLRWGAMGKVRHLDQRHAWLAGDQTAPMPDPLSGAMSGQLDLTTVVKMSQAVSGEIVLDRLIERLMVIAVEHAGAGRGLLLLPKGEEYRIEAEAITNHEAVTVSLRESALTEADGPEAILRYVIRTHESVILDDALIPNPFSGDDYIARAKPRSVLCLPLVKQAKLVGVLYLENALSSYVFTPARISVLQLLALQAAISLMNARLYMELQQAEEKARRRERDFRLAFDTIPSLAWTALPDGRVESLNKQCTDYTGLATDEMLADWQLTYHPDDLARVLAKWSEILETGETGEVEARMRRADGEYRWFLVRATPLHDEEGRILRWYGTNTDIEDRKRAEGLLAGEKRVLDMIARGDSLPTILDQFCRVVDELAEGTRSSILVYDKEANCLRHGAAPALPREYTQSVDGTTIGPVSGSCGTAVFRGQRVFVSDISTDPLWADYRDAALKHGLRACWSMPILSTEGRVLGAFALYADRPREISARENSIVEQFTHLASIALERKRAEEALLKSEAFLAQGQSISHTGSWAWKLATGKVLWSEEHCRIFGAPPDQKETTFEGFISRVHPEDREFVLKTLKDAMCAKGDFIYEYRILLPDGTLKYAHGRGCCICNEEGKIDEYIGTTMDITERKRAEEELRRSEASLRKAQTELAHVTRVTTMGELAASIAHEVNQPLAGIVMNGNAALRWMAGLKMESMQLREAREAITRIIRDGNRAGEVIGRIRSLFKKAETAREPLDVNEMIQEVIVLARAEMERRKVSLRLELGENLPPVLGDRVQLQQVTLNLILNGIEAMSKVAERRRELVVRTEAREEESVAVMVRDNGVGLDPRDIDRIFDAFYTTKNGGLGMGLSISRSILENHLGRLWAERNDGPGATFQFVLARNAE